MTTPDEPDAQGQERTTPESTPSKQHGDPLLDAAQERGPRDDGSRHGADATGAAGPES